jgi:hypothetical protein
MHRHSPELSQWIDEVSRNLPGLSKPQAVVLGMYSFGMVIVRSCGISSIVYALSLLLEKSENTMRQRLREWYYDARDKRGQKRQGLDVSTCFAPLLAWVLSWWEVGEKRLALAMDASSLGQRFVVLSISVMYRGCAIPVAWRILPAGEEGAWKPHWLNLLKHLAGAVPDDWTVIVLTDRGLYAKWLFKAVQRLKWHPFMRINLGGNFRPVGQARFRPLSTLVPQPGSSWSGLVDCFSTKDRRLSCTLLARWDEEYDEPWLILTDLPPDAASIAWYGMRTWIEQGFKDCKRGGLRWEQTKMTDPARATRLWLVIAVATLWIVSVGGQADASVSPSSFDHLPLTHIARRTCKAWPQPRRLSCFCRGIIMILIALIKGDPLPLGRFIPEPWPDHSVDITAAQSLHGVLAHALV